MRPRKGEKSRQWPSLDDSFYRSPTASRKGKQARKKVFPEGKLSRKRSSGKGGGKKLFSGHAKQPVHDRTDSATKSATCQSSVVGGKRISTPKSGETRDGGKSCSSLEPSLDTCHCGGDRTERIGEEEGRKLPRRGGAPLQWTRIPKKFKGLRNLENENENAARAKKGLLASQRNYFKIVRENNGRAQDSWGFDPL